MRQAVGAFVIPLASLVEGPNRLDLSGVAEEVGVGPEDAEILGGIEVRGEAVRAEARVDLQARVAARVRLNCGRCLAEMDVPIETELRLYCEKLGARDSERAHGEPPDDDLLLYYDGRTLDLREEIRQVILLEIPWSPVCRPDCRGLCPRCGIDRNQGECSCPSRGG